MNSFFKPYFESIKKSFGDFLNIPTVTDKVPRLKLKGELDILLFDPKDEIDGKVADDKLIQKVHVPNTVVDAGEIWLAEMLANQDSSGAALVHAAGGLGYGIQYLAVGTTSSAPVYSDYKLGGVVAGSYIATANSATDASALNQVVITATFGTSSGNGSLYEAGLFSNSTDPASETDTNSRMFSRTTFALITKTTSISMAFQWTIKVGTLLA